MQVQQCTQPSVTNRPNPFPGLSPPTTKAGYKKASRERFETVLVYASRSLTAVFPETHRSCTAVHDAGQRQKTKVVIARGLHLFPFRTEKLNPATPMVLRKWESR